VAENFFDTLSTREKQHIQDRTGTLIDLLEKWVQKYSTLRTIRIPPVALVTSTVAPRVSPTDSLLIAKSAFWIFGADDITDERAISLTELQQQIEQWRLIANSGSSNKIDHSDDLSMLLFEIREELSKFRLFEPLREHWSSELPRIPEAMLQEYQNGLQYSAHGDSALPSLDEYLDWGLHSIGIPFWILTIMIVSDDPSVMEHFEPINKAIEYASVAIRLYNDLRTFDKEMQEAGVNSILIAYHAMLDKNPSGTEERVLSEAKRHVLQLADSYAQKCYDLARQIQTESSKCEEAVYRVTAFQAHFYIHRERDYHTTSLAQTYEILDA
jgi:hypothetical protein